MEIMPYSDRNHVTAITERPLSQNRPAIVSTDWRAQLPVLAAAGVTLRELRLEDAPGLLATLTTEEVSRFISPPPTTVEGFERFITWARRQREAGQYVCFGVVPEGMTTAVGLFQVRSMEPGFASAEWGFVIGSPYWGTGLFMAGAELVLEFAFKTIGAFRLEARSAVQNGRGNGALRKLGAEREGVLKKAFLLRGTYYDQNIWSILASAWAQAKVTWEPRAA
jgi:[ribosomal protein S5]-alanine N-acetyltransferase